MAAQGTVNVAAQVAASAPWWSLLKVLTQPAAADPDPLEFVQQ
jgi:hypothetical protein